MAQLFSGDIECKVSPKRMWFGLCKDAHNCLPKALPEKFTSIEYIEGKIVEAGCVRAIKFFKGLITAELEQEVLQTKEKLEHELLQVKEKLQQEVLCVKEKLEEVDEHLMKMKAAVMEGGFLGIFFKSYKYAFEFKEGLHPESCVVHWTIEFESLVKELLHGPEEIKKDLTTTLKGVEAYLLAHNDYC